MFKVISAEIKKILSKPSIYILAIILAVILVLGVFIYNPTTNDISTFTLNGTNFSEKYLDFTGNYKNSTLNKINQANNSINNYTIIVGEQKLTRKNYINSLYENVLNEFYAYRNFSVYNEELAEQELQQKQKLAQSITTLDTAINNSLELSLHSSYSMLTTSKNYDTYTAIIKDIKSWLDVATQKNALATYCNEFETEYKPVLEGCLNSFIYPTLNSSFIENHTMNTEGTKLYILNSRLNEIEKEINALNTFVTQNGEIENKKHASKMDELANLYVQTSNTYINLVKYELLNNAFNATSTKQQLDLLHLKEYSNYNINSLLIKFNYLFNNNKNETNYSNPLTIGSTSNSEINAYDYTYFIVKLFSFVIIAYSVMLASNSIAGEIKEGSMRYFAIRPITRKEIYFGKLLAIITLSTILTIFSSIIALCVGGAVYGFESLNILTIFNSSTAVVISPITMLIIYLLSFVLELTIYTSIALLLSVVFKSDILSLTIILVLYLINIMLPLFVQGANTWLSFYPFSHISIYTLFGSAVYAGNDFFNLLLGAKVYATTGLVLTILVIITLIVIINFIAARIFKHKEL